MSVIVTLTTTSYRLDILKYTLLSIWDQSRRPDKVFLNVSSEPFCNDIGITELPEWLKEMVKSNLELELFWVENTGPYRKLLPTFEKADNDDLIITCDDDVIYGRHWLNSLVSSAEANNNSVICGRARMPKKTIWGSRQSYLNWPVTTDDHEGYDLVPTGVSGIVYRKSLLDPIIMQSRDYAWVAPRQDDLWFDLARRRLGASVIVSKVAAKNVFPIDTPESLGEENASYRSFRLKFARSSLLIRGAIRFLGMFGIAVCDNDRVMRRLDRYRK